MGIKAVGRSKGLLYTLGLLATLCATGCQVEVGGQTLPSPYWLTDDVQYFPPGPEFKLAREAAALKAMQAEEIAPPPADVNVPVPPVVAPPPGM